ncbi:MAG: AAA family ATPase [Gammaproteobacteria bacterium]|nr:AAA family ATPase [Gammaproteobacteria bacterium]
MQFIQRFGLRGLLSFPPDMEDFELGPLNILIGPNGSGKSNLIEAMELLRATPTDFAAAIREGGGATEWLWKGDKNQKSAEIDVNLTIPKHEPLRYRLEFGVSSSRVEVFDEVLEDSKPKQGYDEPFFYYRFQKGRPVINIRHQESGYSTTQRKLRRDDLAPDQSVLAQRKEPDLYPELTTVGRYLGAIHTFREWSFGRYPSIRQPQPADLPEERLLPDSLNLALALNQIEHKDGRRFNQLLKRFFPRFERMSTLVSGGKVQFYLHESGFASPVPATRLSDGTIRFVAILAILLLPDPPPLVCIDEPELGLHPDAVALIAELLIEASERMQLIVATHSDALVSELTSQPDAVIACERPGAGTELRRLEPEKISHWLEEYRLGDLWRMGELGANP